MGTAIKHPVPDRVKQSFVIFELTSGHCDVQPWASECPGVNSKITNDGLTRSGTGCFIAIPIWQQCADVKGLTVTLFSEVDTCVYRWTVPVSVTIQPTTRSSTVSTTWSGSSTRPRRLMSAWHSWPLTSCYRWRRHLVCRSTCVSWPTRWRWSMTPSSRTAWIGSPTFYVRLIYSVISISFVMSAAFV